MAVDYGTASNRVRRITLQAHAPTYIGDPDDPSSPMIHAGAGDAGYLLQVAITGFNPGTASVEVADISDAAANHIILRSPGGVIHKLLTIYSTDGTDGILQSTINLNQLDRVGDWRVRAEVYGDGWTLTTEEGRIRVI